MAYYFITIIAVLVGALIMFNYLIIEAYNTLLDKYKTVDEQGKYITQLESENCRLRQQRNELNVLNQYMAERFNRGLLISMNPEYLMPSEEIPNVSIIPETVLKPSEILPALFGRPETEKDLSEVSMFR